VFAIAKTYPTTTAVWSSFSLNAFYAHLAKAFILVFPNIREDWLRQTLRQLSDRFVG
jgi:hypothetical protein